MTVTATPLISVPLYSLHRTLEAQGSRCCSVSMFRSGLRPTRLA